MKTTYLLNGEPLAYGPFVDADGTSHPANALDIWSDEELQAVGVVRAVEPDPPPTLEQVKAARKRLAEAEYAARMVVGFPVPSLGPGETLQLRNDTDATRWLGFKDSCNDAIAAGLGDQLCPQAIRTTANNDHLVTFSAGAQLMRDLRAWAGAMLANLWSLKDAIEAAEDAEAVEAVDLAAGWPGAQ